LKSVEGQLKNKVFQVFEGGTSIGRNSGSNDFVINESFVSRKHCEIKLKPETGQYIIKDVGSTTGTFIMISKKTELKTGDLFQMGLSEFKVLNIRFNPYGAPVVLALLGYEGPARDLEFLIDRRGGRVGRDCENEISVPEDSQMSARHGQILFENGKFYVEDLESTNKTWKRISAEGEASCEFPVYVNDFIKIGSTVLQVLLGDEPQRDQEEEEVLPDSAECRVCKEEEPNTMCYPCGHLFCFNCLKKFNKCPTCKKVINDKVKVYK
jgi:pSer/pThr/pTyr-binding forkhead associated (FHA) protein